MEAIYALCDELLHINNHFKMLNQQLAASRAKKKVHGILLDAAERAIHDITREVIHYS